jgi:hypothetical protein
MYSGNTTDLTGSAIPANGLKTSTTVAEFVEPLFGWGHTLLLDNYYNLPHLCLLLKKSGVSVVGTLQLIIKDAKFNW